MVAGGQRVLEKFLFIKISLFRSQRLGIPSSTSTALLLPPPFIGQGEEAGKPFPGERRGDLFGFYRCSSAMDQGGLSGFIAFAVGQCRSQKVLAEMGSASSMVKVSLLASIISVYSFTSDGTRRENICGGFAPTRSPCIPASPYRASALEAKI